MLRLWRLVLAALVALFVHVTPQPTSIPVPQPSAVPTLGPTSVPTITPQPTSVPVPAPTSYPTPKPSDKPTKAPTVQILPTAKPTLVPTATDTVTVPVALTMTSDTAASSTDEAKMKAVIASTINLDTSAIRNLAMTSTSSRRRRRLLSSYTWAVAFDVMVSLDALEDDSITSASGLSSSIDSSLSSNLVTNLAADEVSVSGLTVTTTVTSDDDDDSDDKSGLTHAELNAAIAVPILLCFGTAVAIAFRRSTVSRKAICGCCSRREDAAPAMAASMPAKAEETFNPVAGGSTSDPNVDGSSNDFV